MLPRGFLAAWVEWGMVEMDERAWEIEATPWPRGQEGRRNEGGGVELCASRPPWVAFGTVFGRSCHVLPSGSFGSGLLWVGEEAILP